MTRPTTRRRPSIAVIDYEMGNLHSVSKAIEKAGGRVQLTSDPAVIRRAAGVVLPGVGAFGEAIKRLTAKKLLAPVYEALSGNKPFLGICLGLQLLFDRSEENPRARGFGFLKGDVVRFGPSRRNGNLKVPHMGWNTLSAGPAFKASLLRGIVATDYFYFVHSFYPDPDDASIVASRTRYGGSFCSSVSAGTLFACQFHPEKSGDQGARLLRRFVREVSRC